MIQLRKPKQQLQHCPWLLFEGVWQGNPKKGGRGIKKCEVKANLCPCRVHRFSIEKLIDKVFKACDEITDEVVRADYIRRVFVLAFNLRDIRGTYGKGERTLSYWLFIELYHRYPQTVEVLVHEIPQYGSWLDLNKIYEMIYKDKEMYGSLMEQIILAYVTQILSIRKH